jgi:hypothetical protein
LLIAPSFVARLSRIVVGKLYPRLSFNRKQSREASGPASSWFDSGLLRRQVLRVALLAAAVGTALAPAAAQQKMSKTEADYQDQPKNGLACAACTLFRPPRSCQAVQGDISPCGWCKFFDLPD